jgi:hypothetical protein
MVNTQLAARSLSKEEEALPSLEEKTRLYLEWKSTGWSQTRFCRKHKIPLDIFIEWSRQVKTQQESHFCEVQPIPAHHPEPSEVTIEGMTIELAFPNKITARIQANEHQFVVLLREVLNAASIVR